MLEEKSVLESTRNYGENRILDLLPMFLKHAQYELNFAPKTVIKYEECLRTDKSLSAIASLIIPPVFIWIYSSYWINNSLNNDGLGMGHVIAMFIIVVADLATITIFYKILSRAKNLNSKIYILSALILASALITYLLTLIPLRG